MNPRPLPRYSYLAFPICLFVLCLVFNANVTAQDKPRERSGSNEPDLGIRRVDQTERRLPVRNDVAQPGEEIVALRYFRIRKGNFPEFLKVSREGVWPYFEKLGCRVIGMWQVVDPEELADVRQPTASDEYDEVYLATRYVSPEHWRATRDTVKHGGNGPDWLNCRAALARRGELTLKTELTFLKGTMAPNGPYFMPGLDERYEFIESK